VFECFAFLEDFLRPLFVGMIVDQTSRDTDVVSRTLRFIW
jgi:hypothetical protein